MGAIAGGMTLAFESEALLLPAMCIAGMIGALPGRVPRFLKTRLGRMRFWSASC